MFSAAAHWASNFIETVAAVGLLLIAGTLAATAVLWILGRVAGPQETLSDDQERPPDEEVHTGPGSSI